MVERQRADAGGIGGVVIGALGVAGIHTRLEERLLLGLQLAAAEAAHGDRTGGPVTGIGEVGVGFDAPQAG